MHKESTRGLVTWMEKAEIERLKRFQNLKDMIV